jgi:hypothetical protein
MCALLPMIGGSAEELIMLHLGGWGSQLQRDRPVTGAADAIMLHEERWDRRNAT